MDVAALVDHLDAEGPRLAAAAARAGLTAPVPGCPDWTVRDLVAHTGGVHRWAADIVATASPTIETSIGDAVGTAPLGDELLDWFTDGHAVLVRTLREAPADLDCAAFLPAPSPLAFWTRRQAHETAIHRADAEAAGSTAGYESEFAAEFAQDGMAELLTGFARRRSNAIDRAATLALRAVDGPDWLVTLGGARIEAESVPAGPPADAEVCGTSSALYQWLWNRPAEVTITGDESVAGRWRGVRVR